MCWFYPESYFKNGSIYLDPGGGQGMTTMILTIIVIIVPPSYFCWITPPPTHPLSYVNIPPPLVTPEYGVPPTPHTTPWCASNPHPSIYRVYMFPPSHFTRDRKSVV